MTPNQLTLQALTSDEDECLVDDFTKDPVASTTCLAKEKQQKGMMKGPSDNVSLSSDNESGDSIPIDCVESRTGNLSYLLIVKMVNGSKYACFYHNYNSRNYFSVNLA